MKNWSSKKKKWSRVRPTFFLRFVIYPRWKFRKNSNYQLKTVLETNCVFFAFILNFLTKNTTIQKKILQCTLHNHFPIIMQMVKLQQNSFSLNKKKNANEKKNLLKVVYFSLNEFDYLFLFCLKLLHYTT